MARRCPAVRGQSHVTHTGREGRDYFESAQSRRVPELDRAVVLGGRNEQRAPTGENGGTPLAPALAEVLARPGVEAIGTYVPDPEHAGVAGGDQLRARRREGQGAYGPRDRQGRRLRD